MPLRSESLTSATLCATALLHQHHASRKDLYCQPFNALTRTMYCVILLAYLAEDVVPAISKEFLCTLKLEPFSLLTFTNWRSWPGQEVHASPLHQSPMVRFIVPAFLLIDCSSVSYQA